MKIILCILLLAGALCGPLKLNLDNSIQITPGQKVNLPLSCTGAVGQINFQAKGLPKGLFLSNGVIQGVNEANSGYFPVIIDARDERNNYISQIVVIKIVNSASNSQIVFNAGQNSGGVITSINSAGSSASTSGFNTINVNINSNSNGNTGMQQANQNQNYQVFGGLVKTLNAAQNQVGQVDLAANGNFNIPAGSMTQANGLNPSGSASISAGPSQPGTGAPSAGQLPAS